MIVFGRPEYSIPIVDMRERERGKSPLSHIVSISTGPLSRIDQYYYYLRFHNLIQLSPLDYKSAKELGTEGRDELTSHRLTQILTYLIAQIYGRNEDVDCSQDDYGYAAYHINTPLGIREALKLALRKLEISTDLATNQLIQAFTLNQKAQAFIASAQIEFNTLKQSTITNLMQDLRI